MSQQIKALNEILADTYALYLKTQNYHWHVTGPNFQAFHGLFETQYTDLAKAIDDIAERIRTLDAIAPASFTAFSKLTRIPDGDSSLPAAKMITDLADSHQMLISHLNKGIQLAQKAEDEGSIALLSERIADHEKMRWMLKASS